MYPFSRYRFQPVRPLGKNVSFVTACKAHQRLALDGTALPKNDGAKVRLFGSSTVKYLFGSASATSAPANQALKIDDTRHATTSMTKQGAVPFPGSSLFLIKFLYFWT